MTGFGVLERGEELARRLVARFGPVSGQPWLLVVGPGAQRPPEPLVCQTVLLPGDQSDLLNGICAQRAVSYGLSGRDTITLSSRQGDRLWVAVQRELLRADGSVLERQEFPVTSDLDTGRMLALVGAMLLLGARLEEWEWA